MSEYVTGIFTGLVVSIVALFIPLSIIAVVLVGVFRKKDGGTGFKVSSKDDERRRRRG